MSQMAGRILELCADYVHSFKSYILLSVLCCLLLLHLISKMLPLRNLPPGPWGLPVLGYLPFLSAREPHFQLETLRKKYGDVFGLYLGNKYAVFIGDLTKCKDALNMEELSGRPDGSFPISEKYTQFLALNGQEWKVRRKWTVQALRQLAVGTQNIEDISRKQINLAVERFEEEIGSPTNSGKDVNLRQIMTHTTTSVVLEFVCGTALSPDHKTFKTIEHYLRFSAERGSGISLEIVLPWTRPILNLTSYGKQSKNVNREMDQVIRAEVESHLRNRQETPKDLIDFYVNHYATQSATVLPIDDICGDAEVMLFAGADTVRSTTEWFLLCMAAHPEIQVKVFQEIDKTLSVNGEVRYEERHLLPYTEATILESFRYRTIAPIGVYHSALKDTKFCGFDIPKDSLVFPLLWSVHNDPAHWSHPNEFYPERFLTTDHSKVKLPNAFVPFAPGKRVCPGDKVALIESYIFAVTMVQRFQILPPDCGLCMEGNLRVNMEARRPIIKLAKRR